MAEIPPAKVEIPCGGSRGLGVLNNVGENEIITLWIVRLHF